MHRAILLLSVFTTFFITLSRAQFQKNNAPSLRPVLEKVIAAASEDFIPVRGDQIPADPGTTQYLSAVEVPGAIETKIIGYSGASTDYWVWESKLLVTEDFEALKKIYKQHFNDISGGAVKTVDRKYISSEKYESPTEELRQCINQFSVSGTEISNTTLTIDLVAENIRYEWYIWLRVYDKNKMQADE